MRDDDVVVRVFVTTTVLGAMETVGVVGNVTEGTWLSGPAVRTKSADTQPIWPLYDTCHQFDALVFEPVIASTLFCGMRAKMA